MPALQVKLFLVSGSLALSAFAVMIAKARVCPGNKAGSSDAVCLAPAEVCTLKAGAPAWARHDVCRGCNRPYFFVG